MENSQLHSACKKTHSVSKKRQDQGARSPKKRSVQSVLEHFWDERNADIAVFLETLHRITRNPDICHGKPTIRNLRYPVDTMLDLLASGMSFEDVLEDYPDLEREDLLACLEYASRLTRTKSSQKVVL